MPEIVDTVTDTVDNVVDAVTDTIADIGDGISDVGGWIDDEIFQPVVDVTNDALQSDTFMTIASVALAAGGPSTAWAIPLVQGASVASRGGDIDQVLKAAATAYIAQQAGAKVGDYAGSAAADYAATEVGSATAAALAEGVIGRGAAAATAAVITGGDVKEAFIAGGISGAVPVLLGNVPGYTDLDPKTQRVLNSGVTAALQGTEGAALSDVIIASAVSNANIITDSVVQATDQYGFDEDQQAFAASMLSTAITAGLTGQPVTEAMKRKIAQNAIQDLGDAVKGISTEALDKLTGNYAEAETARAELADMIKGQQARQDERNAAAISYNEIKADMDASLQKVTNMRDLYNDTKDNPSGAMFGLTADEVRDAIEAHNALVEQYKPILEENIALINEVDAEMANFADTIAPYNEAYQTALDNLTGTYEEFGAEYFPISDNIQKNIALTLNPNFDAAVYEDTYKDIIPEGMSAENHWLTVGQYEDFATSQEEADILKNKEISRILTDYSKARGVNPAEIDFASSQSKIMMDQLNSLSLTSLQGINPEYNPTQSDSAVTGSLIREVHAAYKTQTGAGGYPKTGSRYTPPTKDAPELPEITDKNDSILNYQLWRNPETGNFEYKNVADIPTVEAWSPVVGDIVQKNEFGFNYTVSPEDEERKATLQDYIPDLIIETPTGLDEFQIEIFYRQDQVGGSNILDVDPDGYLTLVENAQSVDATKGLDDVVLGTAKAVAELTNKYTVEDSYARDVLAMSYRATGGILKAYNGLIVGLGYAPTDSSLGQFANDLIELGMAQNTTEYKATIEKFNERFKETDGTWAGTWDAIVDNYNEAPVAFLTEYIGVEALQEVAPYLIGGGAGTFAKGLAVAKGMSKELAQKLGVKAGVSTAVTLDALESFGASAVGAYEETYKVARNQGYSEEEAVNMALETGAATGTVSFVMNRLTAGIGGDLAEDLITMGFKSNRVGDVIESLSNKVANGVVVTISEGVQEGVEEGSSTLFLESQLYRLDNTRDIDANVQLASAMGTMVGSSIASGTYTATQLANATGDPTTDIAQGLSPLVTENPSFAEASYYSAEGKLKQAIEIYIDNDINSLKDAKNNIIYYAGYNGDNPKLGLNQAQMADLVAKKAPEYFVDFTDGSESLVDANGDPKLIAPTAYADVIIQQKEQSGETVSDEEKSRIREFWRTTSLYDGAMSQLASADLDKTLDAVLTNRIATSLESDNANVPTDMLSKTTYLAAINKKFAEDNPYLTGETYDNRLATALTVASQLYDMGPKYRPTNLGLAFYYADNTNFTSDNPGFTSLSLQDQDPETYEQLKNLLPEGTLSDAALANSVGYSEDQLTKIGNVIKFVDKWIPGDKASYTFFMGGLLNGRDTLYNYDATNIADYIVEQTGISLNGFTTVSSYMPEQPTLAEIITGADWLEGDADVSQQIQDAYNSYNEVRANFVTGDEALELTKDFVRSSDKYAGEALNDAQVEAIAQHILDNTYATASSSPRARYIYDSNGDQITANGLEVRGNFNDVAFFINDPDAPSSNNRLISADKTIYNKSVFDNEDGFIKLAVDNISSPEIELIKLGLDTGNNLYGPEDGEPRIPRPFSILVKAYNAIATDSDFNEGRYVKSTWGDNKNGHRDESLNIPKIFRDTLDGILDGSITEIDSGSEYGDNYTITDTMREVLVDAINNPEKHTMPAYNDLSYNPKDYSARQFVAAFENTIFGVDGYDTSYVKSIDWDKYKEATDKGLVEQFNTLITDSPFMEVDADGDLVFTSKGKQLFNSGSVEFGRNKTNEEKVSPEFFDTVFSKFTYSDDEIRSRFEQLGVDNPSQEDIDQYKVVKSNAGDPIDVMRTRVITPETIKEIGVSEGIPEDVIDFIDISELEGLTNVFKTDADAVGARAKVKEFYDQYYVTEEELAATEQALGITIPEEERENYLGVVDPSNKISNQVVTREDFENALAEYGIVGDAIDLVAVNPDDYIGMGLGDLNFKKDRIADLKTKIEDQIYTPDEVEALAQKELNDTSPQALEFVRSLLSAGSGIELANSVTLDNGSLLAGGTESDVTAYASSLSPSREQFDALVETYGVDPTSEEANKLFDTLSEQSIDRVLNSPYTVDGRPNLDYVLDPEPLFTQNATTPEDVQAEFAAQGFEITTEEAQNLIDQSGGPVQIQDGQLVPQGTLTSITNSEVFTSLEDAKVTPEEAEQALRDAGLTNIDEATINQFVGTSTYTDTDYQNRVLDQINQFADANIVDADEARQALINAGIANPREEDVLALTGEYAETELPNAVETALPTARYNSLIDLVNTMQGQTATAEVDLTDVESAISALEQSGISRDEAIQTLTDKISDTETSLTQAIADAVSASQTAIGEDIDAVMAEVQALEDAGATRDEAIAQIASDLGTTEANLTQAIADAVAASQEAIGQDIAEAVSASEQALGEDINAVMAEVQALEDAGATRDEAIAQIASDLGTTEANLTQAIADAVSASELSLGEDIAAVGANIDAVIQQIQSLESAGATRDQAIQSIADQLGTTKTELEQTIASAIEASSGQLGAELRAELGTDLQEIADFIGKPVQDVTDTDIDFVSDLIAQQEVLADPMTYTPEQIAYDVTGDGIIDAADLLLMQQAQEGQDVQFAEGSKFAPTGLFGAVQDIETNLEQQLQQQQEQQQQLDLAQQQNIDQQLEQQQNQFTQALGLLGNAFGSGLSGTQRMMREMQLQNLVAQGAFKGTNVDVKTPDPAQIGYIYDFESIFANPQQAAMFPSPYAEGGYVEDDDEDELYKLLGD